LAQLTVAQKFNQGVANGRKSLAVSRQRKERKQGLFPIVIGIAVYLLFALMQLFFKTIK
jgi:hypothetical protein